MGQLRVLPTLELFLAILSAAFRLSQVLSWLEILSLHSSPAAARRQGRGQVKPQTTDRQQTTDSRQQTADNRQTDRQHTETSFRAEGNRGNTAEAKEASGEDAAREHQGQSAQREIEHGLFFMAFSPSPVEERRIEEPRGREGPTADSFLAVP